jgi:hypothetical protein
VEIEFRLIQQPTVVSKSDIGYGVGIHSTGTSISIHLRPSSPVGLAALSDCDQALRLDPRLTIALDSRGLANLKLGRTAEAIRDYSDASHSLRRVRLVYLSSATPNGHTALSVLHRLNESLNSFPSGTPKRTCATDVADVAFIGGHRAWRAVWRGGL